MNNSRLKTGIKSHVNANYSYAKSVIQSLGNLDCIKQLINLQHLEFLSNNSNFILTKEFFNILFIMNNLNKEPIIDDLVIQFKQAYIKNNSNIKSPNVLNQDPFHFLYFLLQFIHLEINRVNDKNFNINNYNNQTVMNRKNDDYLLDLFVEFLIKTQNSYISNNFYNYNRNVYNCPQCGEYYSYSMTTILRINVESVVYYRNRIYPHKNGINLNLDDIFKFYCSNDYISCKFCNNSTEKKIEILTPAKVLIIAFERDNHNFRNDIDFDEKININNYISQKVIDKHIQFNLNYMLKSCISYSSQINKYLADYYDNGIWVRTIDSKVAKLGSKNNLFEFEPQILIYEQIEENNIENNSLNSGYINNSSFNAQSNMRSNNGNEILPKISQNSINNQVNNNNMYPMNNYPNNNNSNYQFNLNTQNCNNNIQNYNNLNEYAGNNNNPLYQNDYNPLFQNMNNQQFLNNNQ